MEIIKLNLIPSGVNSICHCSQYDNGRVIRLELFDGLTPYTLQSGDTVTLNVRKPDNTIITANVTATQGNNYVDIVTTEQMCAVVGNNLCDLTITNGSVVIGTLNFYMQVERDVLADGIPSQSVIEDLDARISEAIGDNYYNKSETYSKTETNNLLNSKANTSDVYNKTQVYNKTETDALLANKPDLEDVYNVYPTEEIDNTPIASFTDGADNVPLKELEVEIEPNLSGVSSVNVTRCGKNLFTTTWVNGYYISESGVITSEVNSCYSDLIYLPQGDYTYSGITYNVGNKRVHGYDANGNWVRQLNYTSMSGGGYYSCDFTITNDIKYIRISKAIDDDYQQIELGNTATTYKAYNGTTYPISLGGTYYGGTLDVTNGILTVKYARVDLGTKTFGDAGNNIFGAKILGMAQPQTSSDRNKGILCSKYPVSTVTQINQNMDDKSILRNGDNIYIRDTDYNNVTDFQNSISGTYLTYELATPTTVTLTPTQVKTLLGNNNIFADSGDIEKCVYRADVGLYIDKKISQIPTPLSSLSTMRSAAPEEIREDITEESSETPQNDEER